VLPGEARDAKGNFTQPIGGGRDPLGVFTVVEVDGQPAIRISGQVFGELRTQAAFSNYHLRLQFKWGEEVGAARQARDAARQRAALSRARGVGCGGTHVVALDGVADSGARRGRSLFGRIVCVRAIDAAERHGQRGGEGGLRLQPRRGVDVFAQVPGQDGRCVKQPDNEKPTGEWNTVELVCFGEDSIHIVNGKVVMRLHRTLRLDTPTPQPVTSGPLILQSEGAEIFYRGIELRPITAVSAEWAER